MAHARDAVRAAALTGIGCMLVFGLSVLLDAPQVVGDLAALGAFASAAAACLLRARRTPVDRGAWLLFAAGVATWGTGSAILAISTMAGDVGGAPGITHAFWLAAYPLLYAALIALLRPRVPTLHGSVLLDGAIGTLTIGAVAAAFVFPLVTEGAQAMTGWRAAVFIAYPAADLVLLAMAVWTLTFAGMRPTRQWVLVICAFTAFAGADIALLWCIDLGLDRVVDFLRLAYPAGMVLLALGAVQPAAPRGRPRLDPLTVMLLPATCVLTFAGLVLVDQLTDLPRGAMLLGLGALLLTTARAASTIVEIGALWRSRRFERGFEDATVAMALVGADLRFMRVNAALSALLGRDADQIVGANVLTLCHPDDHGQPTINRRRMREGETLEPFPRRWIRGDGAVIDTLVTVALVTDDTASGREEYFFCQFEDVTERRRIDLQKAAINALGHEAIAATEAGPLVRRAEQVVGQTLGGRAVVVFDAPVPDTDGVLAMPIACRESAGGTLVVAGHTEQSTDRDFLTAIANVLASALDRLAIEEQARRQALRDPLTGLANRALIGEELAVAVRRLERTAGRVGVLLLDLDRFKVVNDTLGHTAGDELLAQVARRIDAAVRDVDLIGRLGGDEFVVLCPDLHAGDEALDVAARIVEMIGTPMTVAGRELVVSASVGVAVADDAGARPEDLLRDADVAMYRAKERGGDRVEPFDADLRRRLLERLTVEEELRHALERDELCVHYQPVIDLRTGAIEGFEALVRWEHPTRGLIGPAAFIGVAEDTGLIVPVGRFVLQEACRQALRWPAPVGVAVNVSMRQLSGDLVTEVAAVLDETGLEPSRLMLEMTESLLLEPAGGDVLADLKALGVKIALDDFGTGYSALAYLQRHPIDVLKLDRSFIAGDDPSPVVRAVVEMGAGLGMSIVAEGIEEPSQADALCALGCPMAQGFLFGRPMPADAALATLASSPGIEFASPRPL
jgi:diguanylate cyclase (GGDEF)-like protein/PAS domain S-box-containing protein